MGKWLTALVLGVCAAAGCRPPEVPQEPLGYYLSSTRALARLNRVVLVELSPEGACPPEVARGTTEALVQAIQRRLLFHIDIVQRTDPRCRDLPLDRIEALTLQELADMKQALRCDAVLYGKARQFQPYPKMQLGLYLKLINLRDGQLVWGIDHVWDTTSYATAYRARDYFRREVREGYDPLDWELILKSPRAFEKFVAYEAAGTLPERQPLRAATQPSTTRPAVQTQRADQENEAQSPAGP